MSVVNAVSVNGTAMVNGEQDVQSTESVWQVMDKETWLATAAVNHVPWFVEMVPTMQDAAYDYYVSVAVDQDTDDGHEELMDDKDAYSKELEAWVKSRDSKNGVELLAAADKTWENNISQIQSISLDACQANHKMAILANNALVTRLAANPYRGTAIKRHHALKELARRLYDEYNSASELDIDIRLGATMSKLFGATPACPLVGRDGTCYSKLLKSSPTSAMPWTTIRALSPLVVRDTTNDEAESWDFRPHVAADALKLKASLVNDNLPRETVQDRVTELCYQSCLLVSQSNPSNDAARKELSQWTDKYNKLPGKKPVAAVVTSATVTQQSKDEAGFPVAKAVETVTTVTETTTVNQPTGSVNGIPPAPAAIAVSVPHNPGVVVASPPKSLIPDASKPTPNSHLPEPEGDVERTDEEIGEDAGDFLMQAVEPLEALRHALRFMLDISKAGQQPLNAGDTHTVQAVLVLLARHAAGKPVNVTAKPTDAMADLAAVVVDGNTQVVVTDAMAVAVPISA